MPWIPIAMVASLRVIRKFRPDVIYVSCPEYGANVAGAIVQKITGIPMVIDYDDPWHLIRHQQNILRRFLNRKAEEWTLKRAIHVIANTKEMADEIRDVMGHIRAASVCHAIHSSFLPCNHDSSYKPDPKEGLQLLHAGNFYFGRSARTLVDGMIRFKTIAAEKGFPLLKLTSYGRIDDESKEMLVNNSGIDMLLEKSFIPYNDCMKALAAADILVLFVAPQHKCQIPGKLFDYISCKRPVLAFVGSEKSSVERVINETGVGWVMPLGDIKGTERLLYELSDKKAKGKSIGTKKAGMLEGYHRNEELRQLREVLLSACKSNTKLFYGTHKNTTL
jgi:hypothetical protein